MNGKEARSDRIAAEAVGERPASATPEVVRDEMRKSSERSAQDLAASVGPQASMAARTAESVGERVGDAYAGASVTEAEKRSREVLRYESARSFDLGRYFDRQTYTALIAFAAGYAAAWLIERARSR